MKRINLLAGHYGSGKTSIAINLAKNLKQEGKDVAIVDLDTVNPYFRTVDSKEELEDIGIKVIASDFAGSNVDFPALPSSIYSIFDNKDSYAVIDIGGDDVGAYALGRYKEKIIDDSFDMFWVINKYRPLTGNIEDSINIKTEIETASGLKFSGIINNSNLGKETTIKDIIKSLEYAKQMSELSNLPIITTTVADFINFENEEINGTKLANITKIKLQQYKF